MILAPNYALHILIFPHPLSEMGSHLEPTQYQPHIITQTRHPWQELRMMVSGSGYIIPDAIHDKFIKWEVHVPLTYILNGLVLCLATCPILTVQHPGHHWWSSYNQIEISFISWWTQHDFWQMASSLAATTQTNWTISLGRTSFMANTLYLNHGQGDSWWRLAIMAIVQYWGLTPISNCWPWSLPVP